MLIEYGLRCLKLCRNELCVMLKQNAVGIQVFNATVGCLGPNRDCWVKIGSKQVKTGSNMGHTGHLGLVVGSLGHVGPMGHVGYWSRKFVQNSFGGYWILPYGSNGLLACYNGH